ncbi:DUF3396 domain-containing protein [Variovorax sp. ZS18.2.2]|uniref:DUF3396 domain-containing protein n=1 Tax=Variovorax sp. ZS18.2.2 TaxID=2971255 RepID=UPI002150B77E|nr:DUF3396 domain-containing protein [Variovorax sp. ZS18.2.2]MCR6478219.1 DUF3396 domain-containing protein [Variovorax sp. ZS18.2.2]
MTSRVLLKDAGADAIHRTGWPSDGLFQASDPGSLKELGGVATPAFRLSAQGALREAHPLDHVQAYDRLFQVFKPILQRDAERLTMIEEAVADPRKRTTVTRADWQPFHHLKRVVDNYERYWIGFDFQSGRTARLHDRGPTGFRFRVARSVQVDATIPVSSFERQELDIAALKAAMLGLPVRTALAGYGMATSSHFDRNEPPRSLLLPVARKYPAIDVCPSPLRAWFPNEDHDLGRSWICGINWLTLVGEPFLSVLGGAERLLKGLPRAIEADVSDRAVLFQLGERPITGQKDEDDALLPLYHALGRRLKPFGEGCPSVRWPREPVFGSGAAHSSLLWERRFYDGRWFEALRE